MSKWLLIAPSTYTFILMLVVLPNWDFIWSSKILDTSSIVPLVVWFGALGGVIASLQGIFRYNVTTGMIVTTIGLSSVVLLVSRMRYSATLS